MTLHVEAGTAAALAGGAYPVFPGEGEMAARCRAMDWSATPLGPVETWPAALRWAVRTALEAPFPINLWCGPELVLIYNDGYRHVLGAKHPAALGRPGAGVWAEIWGQVEPMFEQIGAGGPAVYADDAPFVIEREGPASLDGGGPNAWFTFSLSPVRDEAGAVVAYLNVVSETTGRILAERATEAARREAEAAEARLRDVFAQAPAFLAVLRGKDFVFDFVNDAYYQLVGHRELLGRPVFEALPEVRGQGFEELLNGVVDTGRAFVGREVPVTVVRTPGGQPDVRFVDLVYYPLTEGDGTRSGVVAHGSDVTAQVHARQAVERLEERLRLALESADIGTWDFDPVSGALEWDARCKWMFGLGPDDELDYARFAELIHPDDRERMAAAVAGALDPAGSGGYDVEYRAVLPDGGVRWIRASGRGFFVGEGETRHAARFVGTVIDVSERVRLYDAERRARDEAEAARHEAEEANLAKSEFLARMSHDLRTPLNAIGGYAELVEMGIHGEVTPGQVEVMHRIRRAQQHLLTLINDILSFARLEAGQVRLELEDVTVAHVLLELRPLVEPQAQEKDVSLEVERGADARVRADRERMIQVLLNLVSNAVKFTAAGGQVSITTSAGEDTVSVRVRDTGSGIPQERLQEIFDPFVQVGRSSAERRQGVGLGLAISRELARMMEGELVVESEVGRGSTFTLTLPRVRAPAAAPVAAGSA